jgi:molybdopterin-guanine dinucleotide biosynthesis protein MobB
MSGTTPPVLCVIGRKNAGKTELTVALSAELNRRGFRVMTVKHGHGFQFDEPGRDSWRHRHEGGAIRTVLAGPADFAVMGGWPQEEMPLAELVVRFLSDADVVLAEGFKSSPEPKIEVFREPAPEKPLYAQDPVLSQKIIGMVTDRTDLELPVPVFLLGADAYVTELADFLEQSLSLVGSSS